MRLVETPAVLPTAAGAVCTPTSSTRILRPRLIGNFRHCGGNRPKCSCRTAWTARRLLPAVPAAWKSGSVRGLRIKGGQSVSFSWQDGRVTQTERT
ncbi:MAG: glycoside hydrolase family 95-like protein [Oscillospiraceae bacterium]